MNPHGGSAGEANANNQNYTRPHFSGHSQEMPHPLFPYLVMDRTFPQPVLNLPEEGAYNIGATTDVPLQENPNVVPPEEEDVDRYLNFDMIPEVATISPAMDPSSNIVALGVNESDSNSVNNISRKRSLPESASRQIEEPKRLDTRSQVRDTRNVIPQSAGTTIPSTNMRADSMDNTNHTTGSHVQPYTSTHSLHSSFQPSHPVQPPSFHSTPFMSNPALTVNTMTAMNAPHSISSPFPHAGMDIIAPIYERGSYMFGPVVTSMGNFPTYRPNWSYVDTDRDTARRSLAFVVPHPFEPPELQAVQLLPGIVGNGGGVSIGGANTYHPLTDHASSSTWFPPQGSGGMHHFGAVISPATQNLQSLMQTSSPAIPPIFIHEPAFPLPQFPSEETRRGLPNEVQSLLNSLSDGQALRFEELMILDYSLVLRAFEREHPELFETSSRSTGLSLETITQYMERETFLVVDGDDSEQNKEKCIVCMEEFCNGEGIGKLHSCVHKFHFDCIKTWLNRKNVCPVCRRTGLETPNDQNVEGKAADAAVVHDEGHSQ